jgi:hypothetical protein
MANISNTARGSPGIIPADLKLILLSWRLPKMRKIEQWEF